MVYANAVKVQCVKFKQVEYDVLVCDNVTYREQLFIQVQQFLTQAVT